MNFKFTKGKVVGSSIIGFPLGFIFSIRGFFGAGVDFVGLGIVWLTAAIIIYVIWSLLQKK